MDKWLARLQHYLHEARPYLQVARLRPLQLPLVPLLALLTALPFAAAGHPSVWAIIGLLLGTLLVWGMAWSYLDLLAASQGDVEDSLIARGLVTRQRGLWLCMILALLALLDVLLLGKKSLLLAMVVLVLVAGYPWLRRRSFLVDGWFGVAIAMTAPLAYTGLGRWPDQVAALLALSSLFWAIGWSVLREWPQQLAEAQRGIRSLGQMFGPLTGWLVIGLQVTALLGWWMAGEHADAGRGYHTGSVVALVMVLAQSYLLRRYGIAAGGRALWLHLATAAAIGLGALFG